jgi:hypothetical protein
MSKDIWGGIATQYGTGHEKVGAYQINIIAPQGSPAIFLKKHGDEAEVLLPRGQEFEIIDVQRKGMVPGREGLPLYEVTMRMVLEETAPAAVATEREEIPRTQFQIEKEAQKRNDTVSEELADAVDLGIHVHEPTESSTDLTTQPTLEGLNRVTYWADKIPEEHREFLREAGVRMEVFGGSGITAHPDKANYRDKVVSSQSNREWDKVGGVYNRKDNALYIALGGEAPELQGETFLHEFAHALDVNYQGEKGVRLSNETRWQDIWRQDKESHLIPSSYGDRFANEYWAMSYTSYVKGTKVSSRVRRYFDDVFAGKEML